MKNFGWLIVVLALILTFCGTINLYSASLHTELDVFKRQLIWFAIGIVSMILVASIKTNSLRIYATHIYFIAIFLLIAVVILGKEVSGARSWIALGSISIQPSEFVKIALILIIARFYHSDYHDPPYRLRELMKPILFILPVFILVLKQPDLGTLLLILLIAGTLLLFMGIKKRSLLIMSVVLIVLSVFMWEGFLKDYQKERILTFIDPMQDPYGASYNSIQSQIAVGSGKLFGKGFGLGTQSQLRFIPEQKTDFAFSVLAEEWGFVGVFFILIIYLLLILAILDVAGSAKDKFSTLVSLGIAALFFWHAFINIGMVVGLLPVIGVPLLFFSYGGSSVLTAFIAIGIVIGIRMRQILFHKEENVRI